MPKVPASKYKQHFPFSIQIELVEGCTLACSFCGINAIREKPGNFNFMSLHTAERIASEIQRVSWPSRIEFAMHGESSRHPSAEQLIKVFRDHLPGTYLMMTSNGTGFIKNPARVQALFDAGLNVLGLDDYTGLKTVPLLVSKLSTDIVVKHYPDDADSSIHRKRKPTEHEVVVLPDPRLSHRKKGNKGNHSRIFNHAAQAAPPDYVKEHQRCAFPFRELSIRWDGNVSLCCDDFRGTFKIANINELAIDELWQHPRFQAARRKLYHGMRDFKPCHGCNAISYRVGLLPDPSGKDSLPLPDAKDEEVLIEAIRGEPFSNVVIRAWETLPVLPTRVTTKSPNSRVKK